jgi:hypothetical protein
MSDRLEQVLKTLDPSKRAMIKRLVVGVAFAVPTVASYPVKELAFAAVGSPGTTVTSTVTSVGTTTLTTTIVVTTATSVSTVRTTVFTTFD